MPTFRISIEFLGSAYHARGDGDQPEWPPSPLRVFQALVAAAAPSGGRGLSDEATGALQWLERLDPPTIVAPPVAIGAGYRLSVPNNAMDIVARAWSRGSDSRFGDANPATHRTMKSVRPWYIPDRRVHYCWHFAQDGAVPTEILVRLARGIVAVGWGIDLVAADAVVTEDANEHDVTGIRWTPRSVGGTAALRVPIDGTLAAICRRHERFLGRLSGGVFAAPPPLTTFRTVTYCPPNAHTPPRTVVFTLLDPAGDGFRSFDAMRSALSLAGMVRHATKTAALRSRWPERRVHELVLGHAESMGTQHAPVTSGRFAYVPLPSIEPRSDGEVAGRIRRVMVTFAGGEANGEIAWLRAALAGQPLIAAGGTAATALLGRALERDTVAVRYLRTSAVWTSVSPLVLPGYDDPGHYRRRLARRVSPAEQRAFAQKLGSRTDALIRKAIMQAGFSRELATCADIEWHGTSFFAGAGRADKYGVPDHLKRFTRLHVRIHWRDQTGKPLPVPGPCVIGGGRFYGLGLMVAD